jgi:hypothetical protein
MRYARRQTGTRHRSFALVSLLLLVTSTILVSLALPAMAVVDPDVFRSGCGRFQSLYSGDIDGDGHHEVLFGTYEGYVVQMQFRAGDFTLEWESPMHGERAWGLAVGDVDLDGETEIVIGDGEGDLYVYDAITHDLEWKRQGQMVRDAHGVVIADLEGDGTIEILVGTGYKTDQGWGTIYVWAGDGSGDKPLRSYGPYDSRLRGMAVDDVDGDGDKEIVFGSGVNLGDIEGRGYLRILDAATGALEWESADLGGDAQGVELYDIDLDGVLNIVVGSGYRYREGHRRPTSSNGGQRTSVPRHGALPLVIATGTGSSRSWSATSQATSGSSIPPGPRSGSPSSWAPTSSG